MPGSHGEIKVVEQNRVVNDNKKTRKQKKDEVNQIGTSYDSENGNQLLTPLISKPRKQFTDRFRKKHKSRSGSPCKGGCFAVMRPRRTEEKEEEEEEGSPSSSALDPNNECFTHDMLRVMLENNDFFSAECNPH